MSAPPMELTDRSWNVATGTLSFGFRLGNDRFTETFTLSEPLDIVDDLDASRIDRLLDVAHLCVGVSYYKLTLPGRIISPRHLPPSSAALVEHLYDHGLRELAVRNGLDVPLPIELQQPDGGGPAHLEALDHALGAAPGGPLVPFGGGKDSTLTLGLLDDPIAFSIHPTPVQRRAAAAAGVGLVEMERRLDPLLAQRTREGGYNGHIPITAINSSISAIVAALTGRRDVVIANERSAEEPTLIVHGEPVNHQYSKTYRFEKALAAALEPAGIRYWSSVRRWSELAIARALASRPELRNAILSCNRAFSMTNPDPDPHWCRNCAKCRFTFLSFAPFLSIPEAIEMFGGNLADDPDQIEGVRALWSDKPFDCVGELAESAIALARLAQIPGWRDTVVVRSLGDEARLVAAKSGSNLEELLEPAGDDGVPAEYRDRIDTCMRAGGDGAH